MQIVHILRDHQHIAAVFLFEPGQSLMRRIGRHFRGLFAPGVVEIDHEFGIAGKTFGCGNILDAVLRPEPGFRAEGFEPAFGRDAGAGEDHDIGHGLVLPDFAA